MSIYSLKLAYVYKIVEKSTGKIYIGSRWANKNKRTPEEDLLVKYFTSGVLKSVIKDNLEDYTSEILFRSNEAVFNIITGKYEHIVWYYEQLLIKELSTNKISTFNKQYIDPDNTKGVRWGCRTGKSTYFDKNGNKFDLRTNDLRIASGEFTHQFTGFANMIDKNKRKLKVKIDDPRIVSGDLVGQTIGKSVMKDSNGKVIIIDKNYSKNIIEDLVGVAYGTVVVKDCHGIMKRVTIDDPRILSGELTSPMTGLINVVDKDNKIIKVKVTDERYLSGELKTWSTGKLVMKDIHGNIVHTTKEDSRIETGEIVGIKSLILKLTSPSGEIFAMFGNRTKLIRVSGLNSGDMLCELLNGVKPPIKSKFYGWSAMIITALEYANLSPECRISNSK